MWLKLWGSVAFNPISALTHATLVDLCTFPETKALSIAMMTEAQEIARRVGSEMRVPLEKRLNGAAAVWHGPAVIADIALLVWVNILARDQVPGRGSKSEQERTCF
jgi:2-dehydropantoate 2-reductase